MKTVGVGIASLILGAAGATMIHHRAQSDAQELIEMATQAYDVSVGTNALQIVDALEKIRSGDLPLAIRDLEARLDRDLQYLRESDIESETISQAIEVGSAYAVP